MNIILLYFAIKYEGNWDKIYKALDQKEKVSLKEITETEEKSKTWMQAGYNFKTILDIDYPKQFKEAYKPPFIFWYKGDLNLFKADGICLAAEKINPSEILLAEKSLKVIKDNNNVLVNYGKTDGDFVLEDIAKKLDIKQIFIINGGIEGMSHSKNELIISEYPNSYMPLGLQQRAKDRLVATLSKELVLMSSSPQNHSELVANFINLGKEVSCFPKEASSKDYNNELIRQGAKLITNLKQIEKGLGRELN